MEFRVAVSGAIANVSAFGDTDIFPLPLENRLFQDSPERMSRAVWDLHLRFEEMAVRESPDVLRSLVPVGPHGFRLASQLDPVWNAYYLALALCVAPAVERVRPPVSAECVFSYRHGLDLETGRVFDTSVSWVAFVERTRRLCETHAFCVIADITEFYHRVTVQRVADALSSLEVDGAIRERLVAVLGLLGVEEHGLPVGGPASRILAELVLAEVDRAFTEGGLRYCRFVDDFRIFADSEEDARRFLLKAAGVLHGVGLSFQKTKTRVVSTGELIEELQVAEMVEWAKGAESADKLAAKPQRLVLLQHDPYSELKVSNDIRVEEFAARPDALAVIRREFIKRRLNVSLAKQVLGVLNFLAAEGLAVAVETLLSDECLRGISPVFSRALQLVTENVHRLSLAAKSGLVARIEALMTKDAYVFQVELHCLQGLRLVRLALEDNPTFDIDLLVRLFQGASHALVRREVALLLARLGQIPMVQNLFAACSTLNRWDARTVDLVRSEAMECVGEAKIEFDVEGFGGVWGQWLGSAGGENAR
jgi:hypothetical protein